MTDDLEFITKVKNDVKADQDYWSRIYERAKEDLDFLSDDAYAQWDRKDYESRISSNRPALTIDQLGQFIHQVANDIRMNTPSIRVIPGDDGDAETAEIIQGLIRNIEYASNADDAYDTASLNAIKSSIGFIRVDHGYIDEKSFDQELRIKRVVNPLSCWIDSNSIECDGRDAMRGAIVEPISVREFKTKYPGKEPVCFDDARSKNAKDDDLITICEYFVIEEKDRQITYDEMGNITDYVEGMPVSMIRTVKDRTVLRYKLSGADILEQTTFPGKYIPLIPVYGEEAWNNGERHLFSLIRKSKSAQRMFNLWKSIETEVLMKQPIAPFAAAEGQVDDYRDDWLNPSKAAVLRYKSTDARGNPIPAPQRLMPPSIPAGVINAARESVDDIKATMGIYNASLGVRGNATSGKQELAQQKEGDVATYHFADNLVRSITHVGRVVVAALPEIYDGSRLIRIIGEEDEPKMVGINGQVSQDQERHFDLTQGSYDVRVVTGASFTTKRQETVTFMQEVFTRAPELMTIMGDLFFKNSDFQGAQAMADRMKKMIAKTNPELLDRKDREEVQVDAVDPEKEQMKQLIQEGQQELQSLQQQLADKTTEMQLKAQTESQKQQFEREKMMLEYQVKMKDLQIKEAELHLKARDIDVREKEAQQRVHLDTAQLQHSLANQGNDNTKD
ncbi:hypothetical protein LZG74_25460 [Dyadobacter sp. CY327]|uniref:portal protein n=1 Tax=Dyadobacter sp. CY327 TaxID=2907301 RepID=UPI001F40C630|nr:portal protein [Dyadobacter sp. CY327]MCE7073683.1 hypothetical protein [Dyadobacter sp. CY327]